MSCLIPKETPLLLPRLTTPTTRDTTTSIAVQEQKPKTCLSEAYLPEDDWVQVETNSR